MFDYNTLKGIATNRVSIGEKSAMRIFEEAIPKCDIVNLYISAADVHGARAISGLLRNIYPDDSEINDIMKHAMENVDLADEGATEFARRCKFKR